MEARLREAIGFLTSLSRSCDAITGEVCWSDFINLRRFPVLALAKIDVALTVTLKISLEG